MKSDRNCPGSRLALAAELYVPCEWGADIGTDHGLLPRRLLEKGICERMLLTDISPSALAHAEDTMRRAGLTDRCLLRVADGLTGLDRPCGCVSVTGMGGKTIRSMLLSGRDRLSGAVLVLSAHTDQHLVRRAVEDIGYHLTREEVCLDAGYWYLLWRAEPGSGAEKMTAEAARRGSLMWRKPSPLLMEYARWRLRVLSEKRDGLAAALRRRAADGECRRAYEEAEADAAFYQEVLSTCPD